MREVRGIFNLSPFSSPLSSTPFPLLFLLPPFLFLLPLLSLPTPSTCTPRSPYLYLPPIPILTGMAVGSIVGGHALLPLYGHWTFPLFSIPALVSSLMAVVPRWYRRVDVNNLEARMLHADLPPESTT